MSAKIRVELPQHLRTLAHVGQELTIEVQSPVTQRSVLDALEAAYPMLRGAIGITELCSGGHSFDSSPVRKI